MTLQEFLYQIRRLAGDKDGDSLSTDMLLAYFTEESGTVAGLFPRQESFEQDLTGNELTGTEQYWLEPQHVYLDNALCIKMFATEVLRMVEDPSIAETNGLVFWALINEKITLSSASGTVRIVGNWKPYLYTRTALNNEMVSGLAWDPVELDLPTLVGRRLQAVRYRMLARCSEELSAFDKAQYFLNMGSRVERDLRNTLNFESTVETGYMYGCDF